MNRLTSDDSPKITADVWTTLKQFEIKIPSEQREIDLQLVKNLGKYGSAKTGEVHRDEYEQAEMQSGSYLPELTIQYYSNSNGCGGQWSIFSFSLQKKQLTDLFTF